MCILLCVCMSESLIIHNNLPGDFSDSMLCVCVSICMYFVCMCVCVCVSICVCFVLCTLCVIVVAVVVCVCVCLCVGGRGVRHTQHLFSLSTVGSLIKSKDFQITNMFVPTGTKWTWA